MAPAKHLTDMASGIAGVLCRRAAEEPDREIFRFLAAEGQSTVMTYGELHRKACGLAALLRRHAQPLERVLLLYPPGLDYIVAFFGCLYAGLIAVPSYPPARSAGTRRSGIFAIAANAQPAVVLTTPRILATSAGVREQISASAVWLTPDLQTALDSEWIPVEPQSPAIAFLQYTSGSTTSPRGVMVSHGNLLANARHIDEVFQLSPEMTGVFWLPPYHDMGLIGGILQPVFSGFNAILMSPAMFIQKPLRWLQAISEYRAAVSGGPNFGYDLCVRRIAARETENLDLSCWKVAFNGAEPVRAATLDRFAAAFGPCGFSKEAFQPCYGLAEATLLVSGARKSPAPGVISVDAEALRQNRVEESIGQGAAVFVSCGRVNDNLQIARTGSTALCASGEVGEILAAGPGITQGYWENSEETQRVFGARVPGLSAPFLRTGDLGFVARGELFITGRIKDLIIIRGRNYYPEDIEETIRTLPQFADQSCAALSLEASGESQLLVLLESPQRGTLNPPDAFAEIRKTVAAGHQLQVGTIALVGPRSLPRTTSGKLQRSLCLSRFLDGSLPVVASSALETVDGEGEAVDSLPEESAPPEAGSPFVSAVVEMIARGLGIRPSDIDPRLPLESLGLDSMLSVQIALEIEGRFGVVLPPATFLESRTLVEVAAQLAAAGSSAAQPAPETALQGEFPLSYGQRALWFLQQLAPAASAYNIARAFQLQGRLPVETLRRAFQRVVDRHAALRTRLVIDGAKIRQRFELPERVNFEVLDGSDWGQQKLREELAAQARRPFPLDSQPPLRVLLIEQSTEARILLIVVHHIVADRWSLEIVLKEVAKYCRADEGEAPAVTPPSAIVPWLEWQNELLKGEDGPRLRAYWEEKLSRDLPVLNLASGARPRSQTFNGSRHTVEFSVRTARALAGLAKRENVTLFTLLLAAFDILLYRYTGKTDLPVGIPVAGRSRLAHATIAGYLVNLVVVRADLSGNPSFRDLLRRIRRLVIEAVNHADYPFALLAQELAQDRDASYAPLFQIVFYSESDDGVREAFGASGLEATPLEFGFHPAQFDLSLRIEESGGLPLSASFDYNTDLLEEASVKRMAGHFSVLLENLARQPHLSLAQAEILTEAERHQLMVEWAGPRVEPSSLCVHQLVEMQVAQTPDADAVLWGSRRMSYRELNHRANVLAWKIREAGARPEARVAVCVERSADLVVSLLAVLKSGAAYVPLDPAYPPEFLAMVLQESKAVAVLTQRSLLDRFPHLEAPKVCIESCDFETEVPAPQVAVAPENLAYIIFTSGSTGRPKGVAIEHRNCVAFLLWARKAFPLGERGLMLGATSVCFDVSIFEIFTPLTSGGRVAMVYNLLDLPNLPVRDQITIMCGVPSAIGQLLAYSGLPSGIESMNIGGEPLNAELLQRVRAVKPRRIFNIYGPTEDTTYSTLDLLPEGEAGDPPIGRPAGGKKAWVLDADMNFCPVGVAGELYTGGAGLVRGYLDQPEMTAEKFLSDPLGPVPGSRLYRTGDLTRWRPDGRIEYLGRIDHQVKVRGFRIELGEIESAFRSHPAIREAVVVVRQRAGAEKQLVAYVVMGNRIDARDLREFVRKRLPEYMVPSRIVELDALPLNPNNKVDRRALPDPESLVKEEGSRAPARSAVEEGVAALWAEVLGVEVRDRDAGFFDLGGHSLLATQVISRIRQVFGVELPLRALFEDPTVAALSARIEAARTQGHDAAALAARPRPQWIPLSHAQQRLWFLDQLQPGDSTYVIASGIRMLGPLDAQALEHSLNKVIDRHEALRTRMEVHEGLPCQVIAPHLLVELQRIDLRATAGEEQKAEMQKQLRLIGETSFDLAQGPLMRACLIQLSAQEHCLALALHHIAGDGWSMGVLLRDMREFYESLLAGRPADLPPLSIQYPDYATWQRAWLQGGELERQLNYWRGQLKGIEAVRLPIDRSYPAVRSGQGATLRWHLPAGLVHEIGEASRKYGVTLFMSMMAAFQALLARYSGQPDIAAGSVIANRNRREIEDLIGFFVNTLVLRCQVESGCSYADLLGRMRRVCLEAYAHQDLPFEKLVEALQPERDLSRQPFFQALLALQNAPLPGMEMGGVRLEPLPVETFRARFDLTLMVEPFGAEWTVVTEYNTDIFDRVTIERISAHYRRLLQAAVSFPGTPLAELEILDAEERSQLIAQGRSDDRAYREDVYLHQLFEEQTARTPEATALADERERWSYKDLDRRANRLARYLRAQGAGPEVVVGVCLDRSMELIAAMLAILKAGAVYLPLEPRLPQQRLSYMLDDAAAQLVLTREELRDRVEGAAARAIVLNGAEAEAISCHGEDRLAPAPRSPDNLAYIIYTSGSTGRPKGVGISHRSVCPLIEWGQRRLGLTSEDRVLQYLATGFDWSIWEIMIALASGAELHVLDEKSPFQTERMIHREKITVLHSTPSEVEILAGSGFSFPSLRMVNVGGEKADGNTLECIAALAGFECRVFNMYGPTEAAIATVSAEFQPRPAAAGEKYLGLPIGRPVADTSCYVLDAKMNLSPLGVAGELYLGGVELARGYVGEAALTAHQFIPDPFGGVAGGRLYRAGDLARWRPDGMLDYLGRVDDQVKVRGFRIELGEIESALRGHPAVREAAVVLHERVAGDRQLVAYVAGGISSVQELSAFLHERLPDYMVPARIIELDSLPLTANGKVDRNALPEPESLDENGQASPLRSATEEAVAALWSLVLNSEITGREANFFDKGGHSLLATQVVSRIRQIFGVELPLRSIFEDPTLAQLSARIDRLRQQGQASSAAPLVSGRRPDDVPLSYAQQRLWFLEQIDPGSPIYVIAAAVRLGGPLDVEALGRALNRLLDRHEVLRTAIVVKDGAPIQQVISHTGLEMEQLDLLPFPPAQRRERAREDLKQAARRGFDLTAAPLIRARLLRLEEQEHWLLLAMHHIVSDGWSMGVLLRELKELYQSEMEGSISFLEPLPVQYADFACWQREWLQGGELDRQLEYWRRQLGNLETLRLPTDRPHPEVRSGRGAIFRWRIPAPLCRDLRDLGRREGVTLFMTLLAGWQALLARYTRQTDIAIGTVIANRNRHEIEQLIGFFVNTVLLRREVTGDESFSELLASARETCLQAYAHQDLPFEKLVEALHPERDTRRQPLVQVMLALQNAPLPTFSMGELTLAPLEMEGELARFDLTIEVANPEAEEWPVSMEYNTDIFDSSTIERLAAHFRRILESAAGAPSAPVAELEMLSEIERLELEQWSASGLRYEGELCLHEVFERQAGLAPSAEAVCCGAQTISYGELDRRAGAVARYLAAHGAGPEQPVGLCLENSIEMVVGALAILKAGACCLPLALQDPDARLAAILHEAGARLVLAHAATKARLAFSGASVLILEEDASFTGETAEEALQTRVEPENLAYLIYMSPGSLAALSHQGLACMLEAAGEPFGLASQPERTLAVGSPPVVALVRIWSALLHGERLTIATDERIEAAEGVFQRFAEGVAGRPFADVPTYVLDARGNPAPMGVPGEVHLGGEALARGFYGAPDMTAGRFVPDALTGVSGARLYSTGELARWRADGTLQYLGRTDHQLEIHGFRIEPEEIAAWLRRHPTVREAAVAAFVNDEGASELAIYALPAGNLRPDLAELQGYLGEHLPRHMIPEELVWLDAWPLTASGKLDRRALPDPRVAAQKSLGLVQPRNPTESRIAEIWGEVLGRTGFGVHENFFDAGGSSLQVVLVVTKLRKAFFEELPVTALFAHPTIAALAEYLGRDQAAAAAAVGAAADTRRQALQQQQELRLRVRNRGTEGTA